MQERETRGSEWIKIDLHVHTPSSMCSDYGGDTQEIWDRFIDELETLPNEIKVLGINDYLFLDGYKKILNYKNNNRLKNFDLILPLIEFRLKEFVGHSNLARLNYHIIFANEEILSTSVIETHFLSGLRGKANLSCDNPDEVSWGGVVTKESLIELGKSIYESTPEDKRNDQRNYLEIGFNNINFEISKIENLLGEGDEPNSFLKGKYFKAIGKAEWEDFRWNQSPGEKKTIINNSHFVFSASPTPELARSGESSLIAQNVNNRLLHSSDAHGFADDKNDTKPKEIGHCFSWIKAEPTFEGLRQILFEPILRRKIQSDTPDIKLPHHYIEKVNFISTEDDKVFTDRTIFLNNNLNTIIGGKSSGKSLLLHYIANTIDYKYAIKQQNPKNIDKDKAKELIQTMDDKYKFSLNDSFDFIVTWGDGVSYKFSDRGTTKDRKIVYIPQTYILSLTDNIEKKSRKILGKFIREILLQDNGSKVAYDKFVEKVQELDEVREGLIDNYFKTKKDIEKLQVDKKEIGDKKGIENFIESQNKILDEIKEKSKISESDLKTYNVLSNRKGKINRISSNIDDELTTIVSFFTKVTQELSDITQRKENIKKGLINNRTKKIINTFDEIIENSKAQIEELNTSIPDLEKNINERIENLSNSINEKLLPLVSQLTEQKKIETIEVTIKAEQKKLDAIEKIENKIINEHNNKLQSIKSKLIKAYKDAYKEYESIIEILNKRGKDFKDIQLIGLIKFNYSRFRTNFYIEHFNKNSVSNKYLKDSNICKDYGNELPGVDFEQHISEIEIIFDKIVNNEFIYKSYKNNKDSVKALFKDDFFDYWELKVGTDEMANMSPGKANLVVLKLLVELSESNSPILIDQPEDNLDNRSIYNDLVKFIRERKEKRQIIIVSHNPNIVVSADSENIIVANQAGQDDDRENKNFRFEYVNGALENTFRISDNEAKNTGILKSMGIREHVTELLEGGETAFKKREEKYGF